MQHECVTLWIGESLGPVERACMRSVLRQGHPLALYCYATPKGTPEGIEVRDAAGILPEQSILRHRGGSVAPFSDWFRYELQRRGLGTWIDTDMYLLRAIEGNEPYLFGEERPGVLNNAVLRVPRDSPLLDELLLPFSRTTPWWLPPSHKLRSRVREWATGAADVEKMPWGTTGPAALTAAANKLDLSSHACAPSVFYPVPWEAALWILDPAVGIDDVVRRDTVGVHLWNECIRHLKHRAAREGSFLHRLQQEDDA